MRVVCAVTLHDGRVMACQRAGEKSEGGKWEFPGGKVEEGESDGQALAREIEEELAIGVEVGSLVKRVTRGEVDLWAYRCHWERGKIEVREHQEIRWIGPADGDSLDWALADVVIWEEVRRTCFSRA